MHLFLITNSSFVNNGNNLQLIQLNGYLVSNNKTINFPVLGEVSVADKTTKDLENYLKNRLEVKVI